MCLLTHSSLLTPPIRPQSFANQMSVAPLTAGVNFVPPGQAQAFACLSEQPGSVTVRGGGGWLRAPPPGQQDQAFTCLSQ